MDLLKSLFATPIQRAAQSNNLSKLREAVQRNSNIDEPEIESGNTALMMASSAGYDACCRELLARGADVCLRNKEGKTALHLAVSGGHVEVVRALLRHSPRQLSTRDKAGKLPQDYCQPKYPGVVTLLGQCRPRQNERSLHASSSPQISTPRSADPASAGPQNSAAPLAPAAASQQLPAPCAQANRLTASGTFPVQYSSPYQSVYPPNPEAAYNYVLRPVAPSPPSGVPSTAPAAPASPMACSVQSGNQGGGELLGPSIGSGYSSSSTQPSTQPASYKYPSISPQASHCAPSGDVYALDLQRQMEQLAIRSNTQQQVQPAQQAAVVPSPTLGRVYTKQDIDHATDHFSPLRRIGGGGFGTVYRGLLDGISVAVKVMDCSPDAMQGLREFTQEMEILGRVHHPHIVLLIGACLEGVPALVYELAEGGSLEDCLFKPRAGMGPLSWQDRVRIVAEVAAALLFLHSSHPPVAHMDIKPANILLTKGLTAKLGDVGLSRIMKRPAHLPPGVPAPSSAQASHLVGTLTYVDPEYMRTGEYSTKSDIYALGMVMLQLMTGQDKGTVVPFVEQACNDAQQDPGRFAEVFDPSVRQSWPVADALEFAQLALQCLEFRRKDRPDLRTAILPTLLKLRKKASGPGIPDGLGLPAPAGGQSIAVPALFVCPITTEIMRFPVVAADGYTYEQSAIESWIKRSPTSPLTNLALPHTGLTPHHNLRSAISDWLQLHG